MVRGAGILHPSLALARKRGHASPNGTQSEIGRQAIEAPAVVPAARAAVWAPGPGNRIMPITGTDTIAVARKTPELPVKGGRGTFQLRF